MTAIRFLAAPDAQHQATPSGAHHAFVLLRTVFTIAPIAFGLDKFFDVLTTWEQYLAGPFDEVIPGSAHQAMLMVGVVEIVAGLLVAVRPDLGGYVVAAWLAGIIVNLLLVPGFYDVALRDFGLLVAALALARLAGEQRVQREHRRLRPASADDSSAS